MAAFRAGDEYRFVSNSSLADSRNNIARAYSDHEVSGLPGTERVGVVPGDVGVTALARR